MAKSKGEPCCGFSLCYSSVLGFRLCLASSSACRCLFSSHASRISVRISPSVLLVALEAARMLNRSWSCRISPLMYRFLLVFKFSQSSSSLSMATPMRFWVRPFPLLLNLYFPVGSVMSFVLVPAGWAGVSFLSVCLFSKHHHLQGVVGIVVIIVLCYQIGDASLGFLLHEVDSLLPFLQCDGGDVRSPFLVIVFLVAVVEVQRTSVQEDVCLSLVAECVEAVGILQQATR